MTVPSVSIGITRRTCLADAVNFHHLYVAFTIDETVQ